MKISRIKRLLKRNEIKVFKKILKDSGFFEFQELWEEIITNSIAHIQDQLSIEDYFLIQDIKFEAYDHFRECINKSYLDNEGYSTSFFTDGAYLLVDRHYQIIHDYYIDDEIRNEYNVHDRIQELNGAFMVLSKLQFNGRMEPLKNYVRSSLEFYKNKLPVSPLNKSIITAKRSVSNFNAVITTFEDAAINENALDFIISLLIEKTVIDDQKVFIEPAINLYSYVRKLKKLGYFKPDVKYEKLHLLTNKAFSCNRSFQNFKQAGYAKLLGVSSFN